jgi:amino acid transporter
MATAVISGTEAIKYAHSIWEMIPVIPVTVGLLFLFMGLVILGIGESSKVAIGIFIFHLTSLTLLCGFSIFYFFFQHGFDTLLSNFAVPTEVGIASALFLGFSAAMLGISGFESSANYVEEQQKGVFPKTLRNMWVVVTIFNPLIAFLALAIIPLDTVTENQDYLLSLMGDVSGGGWLSFVVGIDAVLVLSGAVLTSFVGIGGLMQRMALDRILPEIMLRKNKRDSPYIIYIIFFLLCVSILFVTSGDLAKLAGVYTIAFLAVMVLFGIGNLLLKINRRRLPRPERSSWIGLLIAIAAVASAIVGNIILNPGYLTIFIEYLIPALLVVFFMLYRKYIFKGFLQLLEYVFPEKGKLFTALNNRTQKLLEHINGQQFVYFTHRDDVEALNKVMLYVMKNEPTKKIKIVAIKKEGEEMDEYLKLDIKVLDRAYPDIHIEYREEEGEFSPEMVQKLSKEWHIPTNFMFIGSPGDAFPYEIQELGEVRLII